jgi:tetratricopeptide (TPR) repeat protein
MKRTCLALVALLSLASAACSEPKTNDHPSSVRATAADPDATRTSEERLALAPVRGAGAADIAVASAQRAVRQNVQKDDAWIVLGRAWVRKARESNDPGFYLNADACAAVVLARNADDKLALDLRGLVLLNGHKFEEARALAVQVTAKHPEDPMAWGNLGDALLELGRYDEASAAVQHMVDLKPNLPSYSRAAHLQWVRGDVSSAKQTVRAALDAGRDRTRDAEPGAWVLVQAAMIFWHEGDYEGADAGCDRALERVSSFAPALVCKGRVAMARKDHARAAELFGRAYEASPLVETAWLVGDARAALGDAKGAADAYAIVEKEGRRTDPRTLSTFWSTKGTHADEALALAREEHAVRKDILTEDALAWALYRAGKIDEAKASIRAARALGTPDARLLFHEGAIRVAAGETEKGRKLVQQAIAMNPSFDATAAEEAARLAKEPLAVR